MITVFATLTSTKKGYKDIITSFKVEETSSTKDWQRLALNKIAKKNLWTKDDFNRYGYTKISYQKEGEGYKVHGSMLPTTFNEAVVLCNGLPIAVAANEEEAKAVVTTLKTKDTEPKFYKIYVVEKWLNEKDLEKCKARVKV